MNVAQIIAAVSSVVTLVATVLVLVTVYLTNRMMRKRLEEIDELRERYDKHMKVYHRR